MGQFIYRIHLNRPKLLVEGPTNAEAETLAAHADYLEAQAKDSKVLLAGRTQINEPAAFGIVILDCESEDEARGIMEADPAVRDQVMTAELFPYRIAVVSQDILELAKT